MKDIGIKPEMIDEIREIFKKFTQIDQVMLYGSRAKGNFRPNSDIDLTLVGKGIDLSILRSIEMQLDDLLLPIDFDISIYHQISNQELIDHIQRVGFPLYIKAPDQ